MIPMDMALAHITKQDGRVQLMTINDEQKSRWPNNFTSSLIFSILMHAYLSATSST